MTDFSDSPSGLDPKTMKPWVEMSEAERLEYRDLIARRAEIKLCQCSLTRKTEEENLRTTRIFGYGLIVFILIMIFLIIVSK